MPAGSTSTRHGIGPGGRPPHSGRCARWSAPAAVRAGWASAARARDPTCVTRTPRARRLQPVRHHHRDRARRAGVLAHQAPVPRGRGTSADHARRPEGQVGRPHPRAEPRRVQAGSGAHHDAARSSARIASSLRIASAGRPAARLGPSCTRLLGERRWASHAVKGSRQVGVAARHARMVRHRCDVVQRPSTGLESRPSVRTPRRRRPDPGDPCGLATLEGREPEWITRSGDQAPEPGRGARGGPGGGLRGWQRAAVGARARDAGPRAGGGAGRAWGIWVQGPAGTGTGCGTTPAQGRA